jgi:hypothetical protein
LFYIFIIYLPDQLSEAKTELFVDDTSVIIHATKLEDIQAKINNTLLNSEEWLLKNRLALNLKKCA